MPKQIEESKKQVGKVDKVKKIQEISFNNNGLNELKNRRIARIAKTIEVTEDEDGNHQLSMSNQLFFNDITRPIKGGVFTKLEYFTQKCLSRNYQITKIKCFAKGQARTGNQYSCFEICFGFDINYGGELLCLKATLFENKELKLNEGSVSILRHFSKDPNKDAPLTIGQAIRLPLTNVEWVYLANIDKGDVVRIEEVKQKTLDSLKIEEEDVILECPESPFVIKDYGKEDDSEFQIGGSSEPAKKVTLQEFKEAVNERTPLKDITQRTKTVIKRSFADDYEASGSN